MAKSALIVSCFFLICGQLTWGADTESVAKLHELHESLEKLRTDIYGNCSYSAVQTETLTGDGLPEDQLKPRVTSYKFWSRENSFVRLDVFADLEDPDRATERWIVRPEGFAHFTRAGKDGELIMTDWNLGRNDKAMSRIRGTRIYLPSTNIGYSNIELWFGRLIGLPGWSEKAPKATVSELVDDGKVLSFESVIELGTWVRKSQFQLDQTRGGVISSVKIDAMRDGTASRRSVIYEYDSEKHNTIPRRYVDTLTDRRPTSGITTMDFSDVVLEPAPLEIFDIAGVSSGRSASGYWSRRAILLAIGLSLIAVYMATRRKAT